MGTGSRRRGAHREGGTVAMTLIVPCLPLYLTVQGKWKRAKT